MDSAAVAYLQEVSSRKKLAKMDLYRKGGRGTSPLGKKQLTNAEIEARHGECITYNLNRFMAFGEFRAMPKDIQVMWINAIQDKYDVGLYPISKIIFKFPNEQSLTDHLKRNQIFKDVHPERRRRKTGLKQLETDVENFRKGLMENPQIVATIPAHLEEEEQEIPKFMSYEEFKELPKDDKVIFVNRLLDEYGVGMNALDVILWKFKANGCLRAHLKSQGILEQIHAPKSTDGSSKKFREGRERLRLDVEQWLTPKEAVPVIEPITGKVYTAEMEDIIQAAGFEKEETVEPIIVEGPIDICERATFEAPPKMQAMSMKFELDYEANQIDIWQLQMINSMAHGLEDGKKLHIRIEVEAIADH